MKGPSKRSARPSGVQASLWILVQPRQWDLDSCPGQRGLRALVRRPALASCLQGVCCESVNVNLMAFGVPGASRILRVPCASVQGYGNGCEARRSLRGY